MNNCVAINIIVDDKLMNDRGIPYLLYWDGKSPIDEVLRNDEQFISKLNSTVMTVSNYPLAKIAYFYFTEDEEHEWEEKYADNVIDIQTWIPLADMLNINLAMRYVMNINLELYNKAFGLPYKETKNVVEDVKAVWKSFKSKYQTRLTKTTYTEYIRTEIVKLPLSDDNKTFIMNELSQMITE
jgi:hypothetical protein